MPSDALDRLVGITARWAPVRKPALGAPLAHPIAKKLPEDVLAGADTGVEQTDDRGIAFGIWRRSSLALQPVAPRAEAVPGSGPTTKPPAAASRPAPRTDRLRRKCCV